MVPSFTSQKARSLDPDDLRTAVQTFDSAIATLGGDGSDPCSVRYELARFIIERSLDGDVVTDFDGVAVVVDRMSVPYLNGAVIDFVDTIEKQGFTIDNPNATGSCACGDSFH